MPRLRHKLVLHACYFVFAIYLVCCTVWSQGAYAQGGSSGYTLVELLAPDGWIQPIAAGINTSGQIAVYAGKTTLGQDAFLWSQAGGWLDLGNPSGTFDAAAMGINDSGQIAGVTLIKQPSNEVAFAWSRKTGMVLLSTLPGLDSAGTVGIDAGGDIAGYVFDFHQDYHAVLWIPTESGYQIKDLGLPGGAIVGAKAFGMNASQEVVGDCWDSAWNYHPFLWTASGGMTDLGVPGGMADAGATGINAAGQVSARSWNSDEHAHAYVWSRAAGWVKLDEPPNATQSIAYAINDAGVIGGMSIDQAGNDYPVVWLPSTSSTGKMTWTLLNLGLPPGAAGGYVNGMSNTGVLLITSFDAKGAYQSYIATPIGISISPSTVIGGQKTTGTITLVTPSATVVLKGTAGVTVPASVKIPAGSNSTTFTINTPNVLTNTAASVSATYGGIMTSSAFNLTSNSLASFTVSPGTVIGTVQSKGTITLTTPTPTALSVTLKSSHTAVTVPSTVTIPAGAASVAFTIKTGSVSMSTTGTLTATYNGASKTASLEVTPITVKSLTLSPSTVIGSLSSTGTVTLVVKAPASMVVALQSNNAAVMVPASVTVASGSATAQFKIQTKAVTSNTTVTITGSLNGYDSSASLKVIPIAVQSLTLSPASVTGGKTSTGTVTLNAPAVAGASVALKSSIGAAVVSSTVKVSTGSTTATFTITTKSVTSNKTANISATLGSVTKTAVLTISP
jgi:hypothetical protein